MSRLCVRVAGAAEWRLMPFEPGGGWAALEAALLRTFSADPRVVAVAHLGVCIGDAQPRLLARDCVGHLQNMDCVEVVLRRRDEAAPGSLAALMSAPFASPATPRHATRGVKRDGSPARDARAAKAPSPSPSRDASREATPVPADAAAADAADAAAADAVDEDVDTTEVPPLRCFKVGEHGRHALLVGEKPSGRSGAVAKQLDDLAQRVVATIISFATPHVNFAEEARRRGFTIAVASAADDRESGFKAEQLDACAERIQEALQRGGVYLHCEHGRSRSPSFAMAYLMRFQGKSFSNARRAVAMGVRFAGRKGIVGLAPTVLEPPNSARAVRFAVVYAQLRAYDMRCTDLRAEAAAGNAAAQGRVESAVAADDDVGQYLLDAPARKDEREDEAQDEADAEAAKLLMAHLLSAAKAGDAAQIRELLQRRDVAAACRRLAATDVNPLHVAVLALHTDAVAALLDAGPPFRAAMHGRVDMSDRGDGLGDVRRALPYCCTAAEVLQKRVEDHCRSCLILRRGYAQSAEGRKEREQLDAMARVLHGMPAPQQSHEQDAPVEMPAPAVANA